MPTTRRRTGLLILLAVFAVSTCDSEPASPPTPVSVTVSPLAPAVDVGGTVQLQAQVSGATSQVVTWSSAAAGVASVNAAGLVTGLASGTAEIRATTTAGGGATGSATVTVSTVSVAVTPASAALERGETQQFTAAVTGAVDGAVTWSVSDEGVASVSADGLVTALEDGSVTVTARSVAVPAAEGSAALIVSDPTLVTREIGPAGGEIVSQDGRLRLVVPPGALSETRTLSLAGRDTADLGAAFDGLVDGRVWEAGPSGLAFTAPVTVEYTAGPPVIEDGAMAVDLAVLFTQAGSSAEALADLQVTAHGDSGTVRVTGTLTHFSPIVVELKAGTLVARVVGVPDEATVGAEHPVRFTVERTNWTAADELQSVRVFDVSRVFEPLAARTWELAPGADPDVLESEQAYACQQAEPATFDVDFSAVVAKAQHLTEPFPMVYRATAPLRPVICRDAPGMLQPGTYGIQIRQPFRLFRLGREFGGMSSSIGLVTFSGADAGGAGAFSLFDLSAHVPLLDRSVSSPYLLGAAGVVGPEPGMAAGLLAYGEGGLSLYGSIDGFADPYDTRTGIRVNDAAHAGGGRPSDAIVFASRDLGVGFVTFDTDLGQFVISDEVLPESAFFGDPMSAYIDRADGPALVLARSSNSRLYIDRRDGTAPAVAATGLGFALGILRCRPPICLVMPQGGVTDLPVFRFDGQSAPVRAPDAALGFTATEAALKRRPGGNIGALVVGYAGSTDRAAEIEFGADGSVLRMEPVAVPGDCRGLGGAAWARDDAGVALIVTCYSTHNFFIERSRLFDGG